MLEINRIHKTYQGTPILHDVSLELASGETLALLGPSGCGKTTLLRIIAGLEQADAGSLHFAGTAIDALLPHQREFGLMFQEYALFPHLDVAANVGYGLRMRGKTRRQQAERVGTMLDLVGLRGYERRRVFELSGGERQRVALARALAPNPRLLMLDEPLAALDRSLRERLQEEIRRILRRIGVTAIYVTHDQEEAFALADRIGVMQAGELVQIGTPAEVYAQPRNAQIARFLGLRNLIEARVATDGHLETSLGLLAYRHSEPRPKPGIHVTALIYPDAATLTETSAGAPNRIAARISSVQFRGRFYRVQFATAVGELVFELEQCPKAPTDQVSLDLAPERIAVVGAS
jgi:ABC-type Fe3+/spermidine/putrescine transport system ATPase subunit